MAAPLLTLFLTLCLTWRAVCPVCILSCTCSCSKVGGSAELLPRWQICLRATLCVFVTCAGKPAHPIHNCPKQQFPWRPTVIDQIKEFLLCLEFRSAVQLTVGKSCATQSVPSSHLQCASKAAPTDFAPATIAFALTCTGFLLLTCRSTCGLSVCIHQQA